MSEMQDAPQETTGAETRDIWFNSFAAIRVERLPGGAVALWELLPPTYEADERWGFLGNPSPGQATAVAAALTGPDRVTLPRDRVAWLLDVAELACQWVTAPAAESEEAGDKLFPVVDQMQPGWLDALPKGATDGTDGDPRNAQPEPGYAWIWGEELDRLRQIESAAREYAEARRGWEAAMDPSTEWPGQEEIESTRLRQQTARANLLALFPLEVPA